MAIRRSGVFRPATPLDCDTCPASHRDLFAHLGDVDRSRLIASVCIAPFDPHQVIYHAGDPGEFVYIVHFGLVKLLRYSPNGTARIVGLARSGDTIGLAALPQIPYRRTAVTMSACRVCRIPAALVRDYNRHHPEFLASILERYEASIEMADTFLTDLSTGSAHARLARLLLFLTEKDGHNEAPLLNREEIGALLGITTETASRIVAEFRRDMLVEVVASDRCRCNTEGLNRVARGG